LLPIQNIQAQLSIALGLVLLAFPLANKGQASGISYDKKEIGARISA
jgi:hypothetical protein